MSDFIYRFFLVEAHVETVSTIDHDAGTRTYILISMTYPAGLGRLWIVLSDYQRRHVIESFRPCPVVPQSQFEIGRAKETEKVSLRDMFMRAASHPGFS